jgi:hypothetical protein
MDWTQQVKTAIANEPYNPEEVWTVEGPTRKAQENLRKKKDRLSLKHSLETQAEQNRTIRTSDRTQELSEGMRLCDDDNKKFINEKQMVAFKKQLFAQEMMNTWEKQVAYKKTLEHLEDLY